MSNSNSPGQQASASASNSGAGGSGKCGGSSWEDYEQVSRTGEQSKKVPGSGCAQLHWTDWSRSIQRVAFRRSRRSWRYGKDIRDPRRILYWQDKCELWTIQVPYAGSWRKENLRQPLRNMCMYHMRSSQLGLKNFNEIGEIFVHSPQHWNFTVLRVNYHLLDLTTCGKNGVQNLGCSARHGGTSRTKEKKTNLKTVLGWPQPSQYDPQTKKSSSSDCPLQP